MRVLRPLPARGITLLTILVLTSSPTIDARAELRESVIEARDGSSISVEYGQLRVPENRADAASRQIEVAYVRVRSPRQDPLAPLFFLAGGPGASGIDAIEGFVRNGGQGFLELMGGDVIGIDQRGVGRSEPDLESDTKYGLDPTRPGDPDRLLEIIRETCRAEAERWAERGVDLRGYTTVESADDVDALRRALGYETIRLWGGSYGSHLGLTVLRRHGDTIERALLTGPEGPDHTFKLPSYAQEGLERIAELVAEDPEWGPILPDLLGTLETVLARLDESPVFVDVDGRSIGVSRFDVQRKLANEIGTVRGGADRLPALVQAMAEGDFDVIARELAAERADDGIWSAMQMVMDSASGASPARRARIEAEAPTTLLEDTVDFPMLDVAEAWGAPDLGAEFRGPVASDVPVLFIVGDLDSRTPVGNARELMATLPNSHLVVVTNAGHNDVPMGMPELRSVWAGFLAGDAVDVQTVEGPPVRFVAPFEARALLTADELAQFVGTYDYGEFGLLTLSLEGEKVFARLGDRPPVEMIPTSRNSLDWTMIDARLEMIRDEDGVIVRGIHHQGGQEIPFVRVDP